MGDVLMYRG